MASALFIQYWSFILKNLLIHSKTVSSSSDSSVFSVTILSRTFEIHSEKDKFWIDSL